MQSGGSRQLSACVLYMYVCMCVCVCVWGRHGCSIYGYTVCLCWVRWMYLPWRSPEVEHVVYTASGCCPCECDWLGRAVTVHPEYWWPQQACLVGCQCSCRDQQGSTLEPGVLLTLLPTLTLAVLAHVSCMLCMSVLCSSSCHGAQQWQVSGVLTLDRCTAPALAPRAGTQAA
jgi:hypothetical protein